jgi:hypothetical protein
MRGIKILIDGNESFHYHTHSHLTEARIVSKNSKQARKIAQRKINTQNRRKAK